MSPLARFRWLALQGKPIPVDLSTNLIAAGYDVSAMERRFAMQANTQGSNTHG